METEMKSIFMVDEKTRAIAVYSLFQMGTDDYAKQLGIGLETIQCARGIRPFTADSDYSNGIQSLIGEALYSSYFDETKQQVKEYLKANNCPSVSYELKGYGQGEWNDVVAYPLNKDSALDENAILAIMENEIDPYYKGEVYLVIIQKAKVYTADDGSTYTEWLNDLDNPPVEVVQEFFEITQEFMESHFDLATL